MTKIITKIWEYCPKEKWKKVMDGGVKGIYILFKKEELDGKTYYNAKYVGMSKTGMRTSRLKGHNKGSKDWTHFSAFKVFDHIDDETIKELEGLFREIFRNDKNTLNDNKQRKYQKFKDIKIDCRKIKV